MAPKSWKNVSKLKKKRKKMKIKSKLLLHEETSDIVTSQKAVSTNKTISIAVPGSILDNAQSPELRTYLAGQIARAASIYKIDEVIVFNDQGETPNAYKSCTHLSTILQYLECPQYLRKYLFPIQNSLKYAGLLNPLDTPHHLKKEDKHPYRDGVVLAIPPKKGKGSFVDVGLNKPVIIDRMLEPYYRVTVKMHEKAYENGQKRIYGHAVSPTEPTTKIGSYWGYSVRIANSLNEVFTASPYDCIYDLTIGTSDKGTPFDHTTLSSSYKHALIMFGGLKGLEYALESDEALTTDNVTMLFDHYINTCPSQGSRTIRTEEAIFITLAELRGKLNRL